MKTNKKIYHQILLNLVIFGCCLLWLYGCHSQSANLNLTSVEVKRVISGQTLEIVEPETNELSQVRIMGIDAPDLKQSPWGIAARDKLTTLIQDSIELESEVMTRDRFNRLITHVWHNGTLVSEQLLKEGYVLVNTQYPHKYSQRLMEAREYARLMGYGIWHPQQPMRLTPKQFRSQHTAK
jgi:micrococcal nuclease